MGIPSKIRWIVIIILSVNGRVRKGGGVGGGVNEITRGYNN